MSILTFGTDAGAKKNVKQAGGMSEELRDELLERKLQEAYVLKQQLDYVKARDTYESVINDQLLKESSIEKHLFIKLNAQKNLGETYESMGNFAQAKVHYTEALKINQKDSFLWRKLGFLQYDKFGDLDLARECLETAANTMSTLEKRSPKICPLLIKLAEISYRQFDFKKSESIVDIILPRSLQDRNARIFALLMKSYFLQLKGEDSQSALMLSQAQQIQPGCQVEDLEAVKTMRQASQANKKPAIYYDEVSRSFVELGGKQTASLPSFSVSPKQSDLKSFPVLFSSLLESICQKIESQDESLFLKPHLFDCQSFSNLISSNTIQMKQRWTQDFVEFLESQSTKRESPVVLTESKKENNEQLQDKPKRANEQNQRRNLRRKMDHVEHKIKQIKLKNFLVFKDQVLPSHQEKIDAVKFEEDCSHREIMEMTHYLRTKALGKQQSSKALDQDDAILPQVDHSLIPSASIIDHFETLLSKMQGKDVFYVLRNLLKLLTDTEYHIFLTGSTALTAFKLYTATLKAFAVQRSKGETALGSHMVRDALEQFASFQVVLVMFELSLFNKEVIKQTKSGPIMAVQNQFYSYFEENEERVLYFAKQQFENAIKPRVKSLQSFSAFLIRLYYCMMYYAFEIKSDMAKSVLFHRKLETGKTQSEYGSSQSLCSFLMQERAFTLSWICPSYSLTYEKVRNFGSLKVKEAQMVRDYDQAVFTLRSQDFQNLKKDSQTKLSGEHRVMAECSNQNSFYLELLVNYLSTTIAQQETDNLQNTDEKVKEMWEKMTYTLCRCPLDRFIKSTCHVFSLLTAFQYLHKSFYHQFMLRKLDFKKLMEEIFERLNGVFAEVQVIYVKAGLQLAKARDCASELMKAKLRCSNPDLYLSKLEVHLLRLFNPEFLQINVNQLLDASSGEGGQIFMRNYFRSLFLIEMLRVQMKFDPIKEANVNLKPVTHLISCVDKLAQDNFELFIRPYYRLAQFAFPSLLFFYSLDCHRSNDPQQEILYQEAVRMGQGMLSPQNELTCFVYACINLFFGAKFDLEELNNQEMEKAKRVVVVEKKQPATDVKMTETNVQAGVFSFTKFAQAKALLPKMQEQTKTIAANSSSSDRDTPSSDEDGSSDGEEQLFGLLLNDQRNQVRAQGINQQLKDSQTMSFTLFSGSLLFNQIVAEKGKLNITLMANLVSVFDFFSQGRLMKRSQMNSKDLMNCLKLSETLSQIICAHQGTFTDKFQSLKERLSRIKAAMKDSPFDLKAISEEQASFISDNSYLSKTFAESMTRVVFYLLNMFTHVGLSTSLHQLQKLSLIQRVQIIERMQSLNDLKKLKNLCFTGLQFSTGSDFSLFCFFLSQTYLQQFNLLNECKLKLNFKTSADYRESKLAKFNAINAIIAAIDLAAEPQSNGAVWSNINTVERQKHFFEHLLQIQTSVLRAKQFVYYFNQTSNSQDKKFYLKDLKTAFFGSPEPVPINKSLVKMRQVIHNAMLANDICQKLEQLMLESNDPRVKKISLETKGTLLQGLVTLYIGSIKEANQQQVFQLQKRSNSLSSLQALECLQKVYVIIQSDRYIENALKSVPKSKLSFELSYLEEHFQEIHDQDFDSCSFTTSLSEMTKLRQALIISLESGYASGVYECLLKLLQKSIAIAIQIRYNSRNLSNENQVNFSTILQQISKQVLSDKDLQKFMQTQILMNSGHDPQDDRVAQFDGIIGEEQNYLYEPHNSHCVRKKILKTDLNQIDAMEALINQLYQFGDKLVLLLQNSNGPASQSIPQNQQPISTSTQTVACTSQGNKTDLYKQWLKCKLNFMLISNLYYEYQAFTMTSQDQSSSQAWVHLSQAMEHIMVDVSHIEEIASSQITCLNDLWKNASGTYQNNVIAGFQGANWQQLGLNTAINNLHRPFAAQNSAKDDVKERQNLLAITDYSCFALGVMKFHMLGLQLDISQRALTYEPIKDIYKSALQSYKHSKSTLGQQVANTTTIDNCGKFTESIAAFEISKDIYIQAIIFHVDALFQQFIHIRQQVRGAQKGITKAKQQEMFQLLKQFRATQCINGDYVPQYLKDIFDLFIETHNSKQFLKKHELVSDIQKRAVRSALLKACAICGPDSETSDLQVSSKFLDLGRIQQDDYVLEGIQICIKWYLIVLERVAPQDTPQAKPGASLKQSSKNQEVQKRLNATLEEIQRTVSQSVAQLVIQVENAIIIN